MRTLCFILTLLLPAAASAETYSIGPEQSQVRFTAKLLGHEIPCSFGQFSGKVDFDAAHPDHLAAEAKIEVASIATGNDHRNHHLRSPDYFDADKHPEIVFHSRSVKPGPNGDFDLVGDLTIKQTTKSVVLHVHPLSASAWDARAAVNRKDFGITRNAFSDRGIGDTIEIALHVEGRR
ncbi:MAG TPA: YceI family protein [Opitutaceae bacterium]|jgi:polyisoprenoid-binding protein YceI|nr:YceI family protein [Opitutaceae bacterium]